MFAIYLMAVRYVFLLLLFLSILRLVKWMVGDLRGASPQRFMEVQPSRHGRETPSSESTGGVKMVVIESSAPGLKPGDTFGAGREVLIGRGGGSDINIDSSFASTRHARVYLKEEQYWLEDLRSTNGTYLNEIRVKQPIVLANGDRIRIGEVTFQFVR
ncbi:MAG: FHA domain-containing protein FhaB [Pelotomaculum sp. PtaU1.Bin035]|nr:MAG: FHA domain-containing protein FhaB [Pelotomaculum sp. PtaU1.Bin035]